jgi:hypothetical protein
MRRTDLGLSGLQLEHLLPMTVPLISARGSAAR